MRAHSTLIGPTVHRSYSNKHTRLSLRQVQGSRASHGATVIMHASMPCWSPLVAGRLRQLSPYLTSEFKLVSSVDPAPNSMSVYPAY